jgi:alanine racemase
MPRPIQATIHTNCLAPQPGFARQAAPDAQVWAVVKANAYGHGIERVFEGLRGADGFALLDLGEAERVRALGWRGPILLLEGAFEARDLELCSRLHLWHTVHCDEQIDMLALHKTHEPHRVFPQNELGHEPAGLCAAAVSIGLDAAERLAPGGRNFADDPFQRRRWPQRHRRADGPV